jgi:thioredoxin
VGAKNRVNEWLATAHKPICGKCGAPLAEGGGDPRPQIVTDESFATEVIDASSVQPVLVDAWAEWCAPCRMMAPIFDQLAEESQGRYKITKLDVDDNRRTAVQFNIQSLPTFLIFKNGKLVDRMVGAQPKQAIASRLASFVQ